MESCFGREGFIFLEITCYWSGGVYIPGNNMLLVKRGLYPGNNMSLVGRGLYPGNNMLLVGRGLYPGNNMLFGREGFVSWK